MAYQNQYSAFGQTFAEANTDEEDTLVLQSDRYLILEELFGTSSLGLPATLHDEGAFQAFLNTCEPEIKDWMNFRLRLLDRCVEGADNFQGVEQLLNQAIADLHQSYDDNLAAGLAASRPLESTYRGIESLFLNAGTDPEPVDFLDMGIKELANPDLGRLRKVVASILDEACGRYRLSDCYNFLALPGYLGEGLTTKDTKTVLNEILEACSRNRVMLLTDFRSDMRYGSEIRPAYKAAALTDNQPRNKHGIMLTEPLVGREQAVGTEPQPLFISSALSLAGKLMNCPTHITPAGEIGGEISGGRGSQHGMKNEEEVLKIRNLGAVPLILSGPAKVLFYGHRTTYTGTNEPWKIFPVVRTADMIARNLEDWLRRLRYIDLTPDVLQEIAQMNKAYLDDLKIRGVIADYRIEKIFQNGDKLTIRYVIIPTFPLGDFTLDIEVVKVADPNADGKNKSTVGVS